MKTLFCIVSLVAVTLSACILPAPPAQGAPDLAPHRAPHRAPHEQRMPVAKQTARV